MDRASELRDLLLALARLRDAVGVLSITVGIEPGGQAGRSPPWEIAIENDLARLRDDSRLDSAGKRRLAEIESRLPPLFDPTASGRGRALYATLGGGAMTEVTLQRPLPNAARLGVVAHLAPLAAALEAGATAGLLGVSRDSIVVSESELEHVRPVCRIDIEPWVGDWWPEMKGPSRANPARGQQVAPQRDRYERRVATARRHALDEAVETVGAIASERGWARAVVAGDARLMSPLVQVLRDQRLEAVTLDADLAGLRDSEARSRLVAELELAAERESLERAREAAEAGRPRAASGLEATLEALAEGRVADLLIDSRQSFLGAVGPGERLTAAEGTEELSDWIVAHALVMHATVRPVHGEAADALAGCGGIAALLRW